MCSTWQTVCNDRRTTLHIGYINIFLSIHFDELAQTLTHKHNSIFYDMKVNSMILCIYTNIMTMIKEWCLFFIWSMWNFLRTSMASKQKLVYHNISIYNNNCSLTLFLFTRSLDLSLLLFWIFVNKWKVNTFMWHSVSAQRAHMEFQQPLSIYSLFIYFVFSHNVLHRSIYSYTCFHFWLFIALISIE